VNHIIALEAPDTTRVTDESGMCQLAREYFEELFQGQQSIYSPVISALQPVVNDVDNLELTAPFQLVEFKEAMFAMHPDKCPGPDGFSPGFYHHFWNTCNSDIFQECCRWLNDNQFPPSLNSTNIALILKGQQQRSMKDWRPIAL
jgi:hypothetical protein